MKKNIQDIIVRYAILFIILLIGVDFAYLFFEKITLYSSYGLLKIIYPSAFLSGIDIWIGEKVITIVGACVAGSAYLLLLILNLSVPKIKFEKRIYFLISSFILFFIINVIRIVFLGVLHVDSSPYFEILHKVLWYLGSTLIVVGVWFLGVWVFSIKEIPFYSDIKELLRIMKNSKSK